jgi:hypothetical protein
LLEILSVSIGWHHKVNYLCLVWLFIPKLIKFSLFWLSLSDDSIFNIHRPSKEVYILKHNAAFYLHALFEGTSTYLEDKLLIKTHLLNKKKDKIKNTKQLQWFSLYHA